MNIFKTSMYNPLSCPRCSQLLMGNSDHYGAYQYCIQCGYHKDITKQIVVPPEMYGHQRKGRRPNRIAEVDEFLNQDRQTRQIIKKGNNNDNIRS